MAVDLITESRMGFIVSPPKVRRDRHGVTVSSCISCRALGIENFHLWYKFPPTIRCIKSNNVEPFVAALATPCLFSRNDLYTEIPVSRTFKRNLIKIKKLVTSWDSFGNWLKLSYDSNYQLTTKSPTKRINTRTRASGLFFTGGVDSFFSLKKLQSQKRKKIDYLVCVLGFDVELDDKFRLKKVKSLLNKVEKNYSLKSVIVSTNLRQLYDAIGVGWEMAHGGGLASVGLFFKLLLQKMYISSSDSYLDKVPYGTHPVLDRLWSTEGLSFIPYGTEYNRIEKMKYIVGDEFVQNSLRVCWVRSENTYNCGKCRKCVTSMMLLEMLGFRKLFTVFPERISYEVLDTMVEPFHRIYIWEHLLKFFKKNSSETLVRRKMYSLLKRSGGAVNSSFGKVIGEALRGHRFGSAIYYVWQKARFTVRSFGWMKGSMIESTSATTD